MKLSADEYRAKFPDALQANNSFSVEPLQQVFVRNARPTLLILSAAVAFVLLIACANVANLLLVRATARRREVALRAAIGAGRGRIIRQLLTESVVLSLAGGAIGLVLGIVGIRALLSINTAGLPRIGEAGALVGIDWRVVAFTAVVSVATGVLFGLMPALQSSRTDFNATLKASTAQSGAVFRHNKSRSILVVVEVALALLLLVGSALLIRTLVALRNVNPGFDASNVLTMRMSLAGPKYLQTAGVDQLLRDGVERLQAIPGRRARHRDLLRAARGWLWAAIQDSWDARSRRDPSMAAVHGSLSRLDTSTSSRSRSSAAGHSRIAMTASRRRS